MSLMLQPDIAASDKRLHVILVAPLFPPMPGGGATHPFYLARALGGRRSVRVHVVAPDPRLPKGDTHWLKPRRITMHRVDSRLDLGKVPLAPFLEKVLRVYARIVSRPGFHQHETVVVHAQHWAGVFVGMHLKHRFGIPLIATLHKTPIGDALGETERDNDPSYCHFSWLASWPIDVFVAGSKFFEAELRKQCPTARVEVIRHGVPAQWLRDRANVGARRAIREKLGIKENTQLILCPVRWDSRKRVRDFIAAAGKVKAELADKDFSFVITAGVDESSHHDLMRSAQEAGILRDLVVQSLDFEEVPAVFKSASVVVVPTDREGLGISVLEAMALKTPVVATSAEGIREIIDHEKNGHLYAAGETGQLAQIMIKLLRDKKYALGLATKGCETVMNNFSDRAMAESYEQAYRSIS